MTDRSKFEQMLEHLINEEQDKASELFHELVVEQSRMIYENILADSFGEDEEGDEEDFSDEGDIGGDETDDFIDDVESDEGDQDFGDEGDDEGLEDRVVDLEDALDDLRAEFEALMDQEQGEEEHDFGGEEDEQDFGGDDDMDGINDEEDFDDEEPKEESFFREYVEKVTVPKGGDNGANTRSVVASANKMGGTAQNIVKGGEAKSGGTKGGLAAPNAKEENFGNINKPGGNAGKSAFKTRVNGHGPEKKGTGEGAQNSRSIVGGGKR
jgi:hypothetical protein